MRISKFFVVVDSGATPNFFDICMHSRAPGFLLGPALVAPAIAFFAAAAALLSKNPDDEIEGSMSPILARLANPPPSDSSWKIVLWIFLPLLLRSTLVSSIGTGAGMGGNDCARGIGGLPSLRGLPLPLFLGCCSSAEVPSGSGWIRGRPGGFLGCNASSLAFSSSLFLRASAAAFFLASFAIRRFSAAAAQPTTIVRGGIYCMQSRQLHDLTFSLFLFLCSFLLLLSLLQSISNPSGLCSFLLLLIFNTSRALPWLIWTRKFLKWRIQAKCVIFLITFITKYGAFLSELVDRNILLVINESLC